MIKWIRAKLFHGHSSQRCTAHRFVCGKKELAFPQFKKSEYPPFDCLQINLAEAIQLRNFFDDCIKNWNKNKEIIE